MKKTIIISMLLIATASMSVMAQGGGGQQRTPEERLKVVHFKMDSAFKLAPDKLAMVDSIFMKSYRASDKMRQEFMESGSQDFAAMREKMQPLNDARDAELKPVLGDANFKIWKEQIEPTMRRGGGPPRQ
jgi:periplasmic protein CpxP/Spy